MLIYIRRLAMYEILAYTTGFNGNMFITIGFIAGAYWILKE